MTSTSYADFYESRGEYTHYLVIQSFEANLGFKGLDAEVASNIKFANSVRYLFSLTCLHFLAIGTKRMF